MIGFGGELGVDLTKLKKSGVPRKFHFAKAFHKSIADISSFASIFQIASHVMNIISMFNYIFVV